MDADPERGDGAVFSRRRIQQDRIQHGESQPGSGGDNGRQRLVRWPGRRWEFDRPRTLLLAGRWSDLESRHPVGRCCSRFGCGRGLQREPGSERDFLRFYSASRSVLFYRWPAFYSADHATDHRSCLGAVSGRFERNELPDLSRRVRGGAGAQRDVCVGRRRAARRLRKSGAR